MRGAAAPRVFELELLVSQLYQVSPPITVSVCVVFLKESGLDLNQWYLYKHIRPPLYYAHPPSIPVPPTTSAPLVPPPGPSLYYAHPSSTPVPPTTSAPLSPPPGPSPGHSLYYVHPPSTSVPPTTSAPLVPPPGPSLHYAHPPSTSRTSNYIICMHIPYYMCLICNYNQ